MIKRYEPYIVDVKDDPTNGALKQARMAEVVDGRYMLVADHEAVLKSATDRPNDPCESGDSTKK